MSNGTPRPVLIMNGVLAGLGVILGGAALADYLPVKLVGLLLLIHSGVAVGWALVTQQLVTPNARVAVLSRPVEPTRELVTGPVLELVAGPALGDDKTSPLVEGEPVDVTAAGASPYGPAT
jgi:hypothetical protein